MDLKGDKGVYVPANDRPQDTLQTSLGALVHLLKSSLGTGILAMPMAFCNAGLLFGVIGTFVTGIVCTHCVYILVRTSQEICKNSRIPTLGFAETAEKVFEIGPEPFRPWSNFANINRSFRQLPLFFSTVVFAIEGIGVVLPIENIMSYPEHFLSCPGVLNIAMTIVTCLYVIIGFLGYVRFGDEVKVAGSITLNLPDGDFLSDFTKIAMAIAILCTYGLQFFVPMDILWRIVQKKVKEEWHNVAESVLRAVVVLITVGIAAVVPDLGPFISLVDAVFFSILGIFVPSIVETIYLYPDRLGCCKWILLKNIIL